MLHELNELASRAKLIAMIIFAGGDGSMGGSVRPARAMIVAGCLVLSGAAAAQTPHQLLNKTVAFSYTTQTVQRNPDGRIHNVQTGIRYTFYISGAGRIFERSSRSPGGGASQTGQFAPSAASTTKSGETRNVHFEGNKLVSLRGFATGASRTVVSFDQSFSSCTVAVQQGRENGVFKRKGTDGVVREYLSIAVSGETCSVREGNPFAD